MKTIFEFVGLLMFVVGALCILSLCRAAAEAVPPAETEREDRAQ